MSEKGNDETSQYSNDVWRPNYAEPWNFTPNCGDQYIRNHDDYDFEIVFDAVYSKMPEYIEYTVKNKTGVIFPLCSTFIEKLELYAFSPSFEEVSSAWVRVPFYSTPIWAIPMESEYKISIYTDNCVKNNYQFTKGEYRLVIFLPDGVHYAYFEITE